MEDEDKHSLEGVEDGEEVRHDDGSLVDEEEAEGPGQTQQAQQREGPHHPGPGRSSGTTGVRRETGGARSKRNHGSGTFDAMVTRQSRKKSQTGNRK